MVQLWEVAARVGRMTRVCITGTGLFTPAESISNDELVESFNRYVRMENEARAERGE